MADDIKDKSKDPDDDAREDDDLAAEDRDDDDAPEEDDEALAAAEESDDEADDDAYADAPEPVAAQAREELPPFPAPAERRAGSSMLGAVGIVMIGLVALAAFFMSLLDFFGFAPADQGPANDVAGVEAPALANVEVSSEEAAALSRAVDARLAELGAALDSRTSTLETEIEAVRGQVSALGEATAAPASAEPASVDLARVETEIAELRALVDGLRAAEPAAAAPSGDLRDLRADVADLQARLAALNIGDGAAAGGPAVAFADLDADPIAALSQQIARLDRRVSDFNNTVVADLAQKVGRLDAASDAVASFQIRTADGVMTCRASGGGAEAEYYCTPVDGD